MLSSTRPGIKACTRTTLPALSLPRASRTAGLRSRTQSTTTRAQAPDSGVNPVRAAIGGLVSSIYKVSAMTAPTESGDSELWAAIKKLNLQGVKSAAASGANLDEPNAVGDTPLLFIARQGHYKYPPAEIPAALIAGGANKEAKDKAGLTPLQVSLLAGWQNIAELLIKSGADTSGVPAIKARLTCPDCKALVIKYAL